MTVQIKRAIGPRAAGVATLLLAGGAAVALLWQVDLASLLSTWHLTRSAGLVAYVLLFASTALGLLQSLGVLKGVAGAPATLDVHEHLSLWALYATLFHALILIWDRYVGFSLAEVLVPFVSDYSSTPLGLGILALYLMLIATVTTYVRARMSPQRWRAIHLMSLAGFLFALVHGVVMGTDTGHPAVAYLYGFTGVAIGLLSALRLVKAVRSRHG